LDNTTDEVNNNSTSRVFTKNIVHRLLQLIKDKSFQKAYEQYENQEVNKELENILNDILTHYHFDTVVTTEGVKQTFGEDVLGVLDALNKVVYLANDGDRTAVTAVEEFSHAFIKMMGAVYHKKQNRKKHPETALYSELRDAIGETDLYKETFNTYKNNPNYQYSNGEPNIPMIKEEALGKALAVALLEKHE
jgi:hypothetical protein